MRALSLIALIALIAGQQGFAQSATPRLSHSGAVGRGADDSAPLLKEGDVVTHAQYGDGKITRIDPSSGQAWVQFDEGRPRYVPVSELTNPFAKSISLKANGANAVLIYVDPSVGDNAAMAAFRMARQSTATIYKGSSDSLVDLVVATPGDTSACLSCDRERTPDLLSVSGLSRLDAGTQEKVWNELEQHLQKDQSEAHTSYALFASAIAKFSKAHGDRSRTVLFFGPRSSGRKITVGAVRAGNDSEIAKIRDVASKEQVLLYAPADALDLSPKGRIQLNVDGPAYLVFADLTMAHTDALNRALQSIEILRRKFPGVIVDLVVSGSENVPANPALADYPGAQVYGVADLTGQDRERTQAVQTGLTTYIKDQAARATWKLPPNWGAPFAGALESFAKSYAGVEHNVLYFGAWDSSSLVKEWVRADGAAVDAKSVGAKVRQTVAQTKLKVYAPSGALIAQGDGGIQIAADGPAQLVFVDLSTADAHQMTRAEADIRALREHYPYGIIDLVVAGTPKGAPGPEFQALVNGDVYAVNSVTTLDAETQAKVWGELPAKGTGVGGRTSEFESAVAAFSKRYARLDRAAYYVGVAAGGDKIGNWSNTGASADTKPSGHADASAARFGTLAKDDHVGIYSAQGVIQYSASGGLQIKNFPPALLVYADMANGSALPGAALHKNVDELMTKYPGVKLDVVVNFYGTTIPLLDYENVVAAQRNQFWTRISGTVNPEQLPHIFYQRGGGGGELQLFRSALMEFLARNQGWDRSVVYYSAGPLVHQISPTEAAGHTDSRVLTNAFRVSQEYDDAERESAKGIAEYAEKNGVRLNVIQVPRNAMVPIALGNGCVWVLQSFQLKNSGNILAQLASATGGTFQSLVQAGAAHAGPSGMIHADADVSDLGATITQIAATGDSLPASLAHLNMSDGLGAMSSAAAQAFGTVLDSLHPSANMMGGAASIDSQKADMNFQLAPAGPSSRMAIDLIDPSTTSYSVNQK